MPSYEMTVDQRALQHLARAMRQEADGAELRRDLMRTIKKALEPARDDARTAIKQMHSGGLPHDGEPLREAIARRITVQLKFSGRSAGAAVRAKRRGMPRGFEHAPKRTNRQHWRHRVYGRDVWVEQVGSPRWFDDTMKDHRQEARAAVVEAMRDMAKRLKGRARRVG